MKIRSLLLVAKFEYLRTVTRLSFWATTLLMPIFIGIITAVSGYASMQTEEQFSKLSENIKNTEIVDQSGVIPETLMFGENTKMSPSLEESIEKLKRNDIQLVVHYPEDIFTSGKIEIFTLDETGIFEEVAFAQLADSLLKQSIVQQIEDQDLQMAVFKQFETRTTYFDDSGKEVAGGIMKLIVPAISLTVFFLAVFISANFLLQSVSEEKENRMIEFILSITNNNSLIFGKIFGLSAVVITQLLTWLILGGLILLAGQQSLGFEIPWDLLNVSLPTILINIYFTVAGFFMFAALMVGVGSVGTNYKDSQNLSSIFIVISIFPLYFITILFADPNGLIARISSIFPLTAPMVLLLRNSLGVLSTGELIVGMIMVLIYVILGFIFATKLFNLGSLMYSRRPSFREMLHAFKK